MFKGAFIKPVRSDSLSRQVFESLKEAVFTGKFKPGEALRELHLARMFEVSQATVREALVQLEHTGLVLREQNRKTTVASLTRADISERLAMRRALEELAFVKAAALMGESEHRKLAGLAQAIDKAVERGNIRDASQAEFRFYQFVWEHAESPLLGRVLNQLTLPLFAFQSALQESGVEVMTRPGLYDALVEAIQSRDEERIRQAVRIALETSYQGFLESGKEDLREVTSA